MKEVSLYAWAIPVYVVVIGFEIIVSHIHERKLYSGKGTITNFYLMLLNMLIDLMVRGGGLVVLNYFFELRFTEINSPILYWFILLVAQDFLFYVLHVVDHFCRFFWAVHVTHHSSEEFNLTVGFRSSVFQPLYRFIYFIPLSLIGFKAMDILLMYSITQIYGILLHTQTIKKLGFLEWFLVTPSHHRVHHASNPIYLDKNMGMVFIIWDRIFGTFQEETESAKFGLTTSVGSFHPATVLFHEWKSMIEDIRKTEGLKNKLRYIFDKPGWSHDGSKLTSSQMREDYLRNKDSGSLQRQ